MSPTALVCKKHWSINNEIDSSGNINSYIDIVIGQNGDYCPDTTKANIITVAAMQRSPPSKIQENLSDIDIYSPTKKSLRRGKSWSQTKDKAGKMSRIRQYLVSKLGSDNDQSAFFKDYTEKYKMSTSQLEMPYWMFPLLKAIYKTVEKNAKLLVLFCLVTAIDRLKLDISHNQIVSGLGISWNTLLKAEYMKAKVC